MNKNVILLNHYHLCLSTSISAHVFWQNFIQHSTANTAKQAATTSNTGSTATNTNTSKVASIDPYANWLTYTSSPEHASFQYPTNWTISTVEDTNDMGLINTSTPLYQVTLSSPNGSKLLYTDNNVLSGQGACTDDALGVLFDDVDTLVVNTPTLYYVHLSKQGRDLPVGSIALTDGQAWGSGTQGSTEVNQCMFAPLVHSKVAHGSNGVDSTTFVSQGAVTSQDLATAKLILTSFKY